MPEKEAESTARRAKGFRCKQPRVTAQAPVRLLLKTFYGGFPAFQPPMKPMRRFSCLALLLLCSFSSAVGLAEASASPGAGPGSSLAQRDWSTPSRFQPSRFQAIATPVQWDALPPLLLTPPLAAWMSRENAQPTLRWDLGAWSELGHHYADDATAGLNAGAGLHTTLPTLLQYRSTDTGVSLTLAPGSPCTGACLKVAGSF